MIRIRKPGHFGGRPQWGNSPRLHCAGVLNTTWGILYARPGEWMGDSSRGHDIQIPNTSCSRDGDRSPTTRGNSESLEGQAYCAHSEEEWRNSACNDGLNGGNIQAKADVDSSQSTPEDNVSRNRPSVSSAENFAPSPRERMEGARQDKE